VVPSKAAKLRAETLGRLVFGSEGATAASPTIKREGLRELTTAPLALPLLHPFDGCNARHFSERQTSDILLLGGTVAQRSYTTISLREVNDYTCNSPIIRRLHSSAMHCDSLEADFPLHRFCAPYVAAKLAIEKKISVLKRTAQDIGNARHASNPDRE
jgi:hypothetical protein